jgi:hypothetical protein
MFLSNITPENTKEKKVCSLAKPKEKGEDLN